MKMYLVTWEVDIYAHTAEEAAAKAQKMQRDPDSIATVFTVLEHDGNGVAVSVDLLPDSEV